MTVKVDIREQMDAIYREMALDAIPWNAEDPPEILVELVESGVLAPCRAVDLGCGAGNCAVWLASRGFEVTGLDISSEAVKLAEALARARGVDCRFMVADLTGDPVELEASFALAYDWEVLHHVFPEDRQKYVANVRRLLRPGGRYLSVCFSEKDQGFGGKGKYRTTPIQTVLYFSSEDELRELFEPGFRIDDLRTAEVAGKRGPHMAVVAVMRRK